MALDSLLSLVGDGVALVVIAEMFARRAYKLFPVFFSYLVWGILSDAIFQWAVPRFYPSISYPAYVGNLIADDLFQFIVLVELSWSVLRPVRSRLPKWTPVAMAVVLALIGAAIWPFTTGQGIHEMSLAGRVQLHLQETVPVLRILFFLALAGCSQLLSIGWRDRELQIATGFGFYSMVSLGVSMHHTSQVVGPQYHILDLVVVVSYICSLVYWVACFATKEAARREFTPQMESLLLNVAGAARSARVGFSESSNRDRDSQK